jgi:sugar-specific transcriptional regulator TrmB/DNA-binding CsgD family transcriptional regulator
VPNETLVLEPLGLSGFEEAVYRQLLRAPGSSLTDLAAALGAGRTRVRGAAERLGRSGLIDREGQLDRLVAIEPSVALNALLRRRRAELDKVAGAVGEFVADYRSGAFAAAPGRVVDVVTGVENVVRWTGDLAETVEREILVFDTPPYASDLRGEVTREMTRLSRGVRIRSLYSAPALQLPERLARVRALVEAGEEARVLPELPLKLHIYDRRTAVMPLVSNPRAAESVAIVRESGLLDAVIALFDALWQQGRPLDQAAPDPSVAVPDAELLWLLAAGVKDDAIARQLGVSVRTVRRRITGLLRRLQATSRFQAGLEAQRRGWLG